MEHQRKYVRLGALVLLCAVALRLLTGGSHALPPAGREGIASCLLFLSTGRLRPEAIPQPLSPAETTAPAETEPAALPLSFTEADCALVDIRNTSGYTVDTAALLSGESPLSLRGDAPTVLILHTHGSESYENTEGYQEDSQYRTLDDRYNMVSIGDALAAQLESGGISVIHDRTLHDQPSYNGSYSNARKAIAGYLAEYPTIRLVLDLHRDAALDTAGNQIGYTVTTEKGEAAKLMLVMGTDSGGLTHRNWQENLSLGLKLHAQLNRSVPGLCRPLQLRSSRFNQDLSPGALLIEVGAAGNTRQEALLAAQLLGEAILALAGQ